MKYINNMKVFLKNTYAFVKYVCKKNGRHVEKLANVLMFVYAVWHGSEFGIIVNKELLCAIAIRIAIHILMFVIRPHKLGIPALRYRITKDDGTSFTVRKSQYSAAIQYLGLVEDFLQKKGYYE